MYDRCRSYGSLLGLSILTTGVGVGIAYQLELTLSQTPLAVHRLVFVGLIEEAFARFLPLIFTFYLWSYRRTRLLSKTEGFLATIASAATVAGLEVVIKVEYLSRLETAARFDALVLPVIFVHIPFALLAGRFAYALGERIHGTDAVSVPRLSTRTIGLLIGGYLVLAAAHVAYNFVV